MEMAPNNTAESVDYNALIVIAGPGGSGRMSLANRYFLNQEAVEEYDPTLEHDYTKIIRIEGATVMVKAEVLKGQEDFNAMRPHWFPKADAIIFTVDLSASPERFNDLQFEWNQLRNCCPNFDLSRLVIVGCKSDIANAAMTPEQLRQWIDQMFGANPRVELVITSAKNGSGVELAFETAVRHSGAAASHHARHKKCLIQ